MNRILYTLILAFLLGGFSTGYAQIGNLKNKLKNKTDNLKNKAKDKANDKVKDQTDQVKGKITDKVKSMESDFNATEMSYAVSMTDNAGLFESKGKGKKYASLALELGRVGDGQQNSAEDRAKNYNTAGEILYASNKFWPAEKSFLRAVKIFENNNLKSSKDYAVTISNLGLLYHISGRYAKAEPFTKQALELREKSKSSDPKSYATSVNNLAVLYKDMGKYSEAEDLAKKSVELHKASHGEQSLEYAIALNNQAMLIAALGRGQEAEPIMKKAVDVAKENLKDNSKDIVRFMNNLAFLYQDLKKYELAEQTYLKAIEIKKKRLGDSHPDMARLLNNLASLYMEMGKYDQVEANLKKAMNIYKSKLGKTHPAYASAVNNLGAFYRSQGKYTEAIPLIKEALEIRKTSLGDKHPDYATSLDNLAISYWKSGKIKEAIPVFREMFTNYLYQVENYFPSMSESEKTKFWAKVFPKFQRFNSFAKEAVKIDASVAKDMYNNQLATKALLLNSTNKVKNIILNSGNQSLINDYNKWIDQKEQLAKLYTYSKEDLKEEKINLDSLEKATNNLEKSLSKQSTAFNEAFKPKTYTYSDVKNALSADEAAIEIIQFRIFDKEFSDKVNYAALVLTKSMTQPKVVFIEDGNTLEKGILKLYRKNVKKDRHDATSYESFWKPIAGITPSSVKKIYLSKDGVYNKVNINTLQPAEGKFVIDQTSINVVMNTKDIIKIKQEKLGSSSSKTAVLFGDPNYGMDIVLDRETLGQLPGTKVEVENIDKVLKTSNWKTQVYIQNKAVEEQVKSVKAPSILHIATHGFFLPDLSGVEQDVVFGVELEKAKENPLLRAGLMFAGAEKTVQNLETKEENSSNNGVFTAYEAMNMDLSKTDMVVLSACETGLGEVSNGEGVYGLQRAFQIAGTKSLIMSMWTVSDQATMELMTSFYNKYLKTGDKQAAFIAAQKEIKDKYKLPYYWGAFVLVNN